MTDIKAMLLEAAEITECEGFDKLTADLRATVQSMGEPVSYNFRILFDDGWGPWQPCSKWEYETFENRGFSGGKYQTRRLYAAEAPPSPAVPDGVELHSQINMPDERFPGRRLIGFSASLNEGRWDAAGAWLSSMLAAPEQPKAGAVAESSGWYCGHCQRGVDASEVTYHEQHEVCGRVIAGDAPPTVSELIDKKAEDVALWLDDHGMLEEAEKVRGIYR